MLGRSSGDTPCAVQRSSNSATADRLALGEGGVPALESAATGPDGGAAIRVCAGAVCSVRGDTGGRVVTSDLRGTTGGFGAGLTYVMRCARSVSCTGAGTAIGTTCAGTLVRTMSAVAIVTPDAAAVLATRLVFETGSARSRISHVRDCSRLRQLQNPPPPSPSWPAAAGRWRTPIAPWTLTSRSTAQHVELKTALVRQIRPVISRHLQMAKSIRAGLGH